MNVNLGPFQTLVNYNFPAATIVPAKIYGTLLMLPWTYHKYFNGVYVETIQRWVWMFTADSGTLPEKWLNGRLPPGSNGVRICFIHHDGQLIATDINGNRYGYSIGMLAYVNPGVEDIKGSSPYLYRYRPEPSPANMGKIAMQVFWTLDPNNMPSDPDGTPFGSLWNSNLASARITATFKQ